MEGSLSSAERVVKTVCQLCVGGCGMNVRLKDGEIVGVEGMKEHPLNEGILCPRGAAAADYNSSPDRLRHPLKRDGEGWKKITWDEALDTIASKLRDIKGEYGARALAVCIGMNMLLGGAATVGLLRRFLDVYGSPNYFSVDSLCFRPRIIANILTFGKFPVAVPQNSNCVILWGHNPDASSPVAARKIRHARENGAKLIVIDPRRTGIAREADIHAQPRPGTDCALALGLLNVIIGEKLYDAEFVSGYTVGFDRLAEHVKPFTPEKASEITWVPAHTIREIARVFATTKPSCIVQGYNALDQTTSGFQTSRAIAILHAITGNLDQPGGVIIASRPHLKSLRLYEHLKEKPLGEDQYPLAYSVFGRMIGEGQGMVLPDVILTGNPYPVKAMIISGSNLVVTWPNSNKIKKALQSLDFLVVMDIFMSETAKLADIVLPAATFLEASDITDMYGFNYALPYVMLRKRTTRFAESLPDGEFWLALAKRMGYGEYFPWENVDEVIEYLLEPSGLTLNLLRDEKPGGLPYGSVRYDQYKESGFRTPSGKAELYSETMKELGYDPLPAYREPLESPISTPELAQDYPLILTSGARSLGNLHSQLRNVQRLRKISPEPTAEISPTTAAEYDIRDGDAIVVETLRGVINTKARVTDDIVANVVNIPHGWADANVNLLTSEAPGDPVSGVPMLKAVLCRVRKS
ncbi:MAG: molybdopterin oxidoreductase [Chloroflexi bacterium CG07_land_8_20_14_0_80_51_10]|nr:MAG: molybdopterin oxidoreductase [Chloroflexi bacterium CG07_land_8_20_14_0_80_51_10]